MHAARVSTSHASQDARFWLWWVAATIIGWYLGYWCGLFLWFLSFWFGSLLSGNTGMFLSIGAWVGLLQWVVLRAEAKTPHSGWWAAGGAVGLALPLALHHLIWGEPVDPLWILAAAGEVALADGDTFTIGQASRLLLAVVAGGALAGVLQVPILRRVVAGAWWWVLVSAAGWGLSLLGRAAGFAVSSTPLPFGLQEALIELLASLLPGLLHGALTGGALVWLWRKPATPALIARAPVMPGLGRRALLAAGLLAGLVFLVLVAPRLQYGFTTPAEAQYRSKYAYWYGRGLAFSPDGTRLITALPDKGTALFDLADGRMLLTIPGAFDDKVGATTDMALSPDGALLATAHATAEGLDSTWQPRPSGPATRLWDAASGAEVRTFPGPGGLSVAFSPDGTLLASASGGVPQLGQRPTVRLLDVASGAEVRTLTGPENGAVALAFSPDGRLLATVSGEGMVKLWSVATGSAYGALTLAPPANTQQEWVHVTGAKLSPDGAVLAVAWGQVVQLWDVAADAPLRTLEGHEGQVFRAAFSPDGRLLATASDDKTVKLWDVATGELRHTLAGHAWWVRGVAFSPDGATLASASFDGTVKLWDVATGTELRSIAWPGMGEGASRYAK